ncbi:Tryprostatin B 6-hydroxylase [Sphaceloma murrayae]|uniref:Tryprostatin B 6-hydroxylase n=1 Tax=Sphaceloma murrayae TaxID=2082308 RepID=A0A2K1QYH7_9PEZI|nr:Tryprostatin B 6-hydroxylase [Sphaceloma murrayae]
MATTSAASTHLPLIYRLFFLYIEPVATAVGAYYAQFDQTAYLSMTVPSLTSNLLGPSKVESIVLTQLANMYFVFALNEALVLRATSSRQVWRTLLLSLLIADLGHVYSVHTMGLATYWRFWEWNAMYWGNLGFVYVGALLRTCFLLDVGGASGSATTKKAI